MPSEPKRKLAAIMFTDMVGYTALMQDKEARARELIQRHRDLMKPLVEKHDGKILQYVGDGTFITFDSAIEAVNSAFEIQKELKSDPDMNLRIGIHVGDVVVEGDEVYGDGVNVASRLEPLAEPGGVCISGRVYDDIRNQEDIETEYLGEKTLKNVDRPVKIYCLIGEGLRAAKPFEAEEKAAIESKEVVEEVVSITASKRLLPWAVGAAVVLILFFAKGWFTGESSIPEVAADENSLAVMFIENMMDPSDADRSGEMITNLLTTDLSQSHSLRVISSQRLYDIAKKETNGDKVKINRGNATRIAKKARAQWMLTGTLSQIGSRMVLATQLENVQDGRIIEAQRVDGDDLFALVDMLTREVKVDLKVVAAPGEIDAPVKEITTNSSEGYQLYLEGLEFLNEANFDEAVERFQNAVKLDPNFTKALYKLAVAQWWSFENSPAKETVKKILQNKKSLPEGELLLVKGLEAQLYNDYSTAIGIYQRLLLMYPDDKEIHYGLGEAYFHSSRLERIKALVAFEEAINLDPEFRLAYTHIFNIYQRERMDDRAIRVANRLINSNSDLISGYRYLADIYGYTGELDKSIENYEKAADLNKGNYESVRLQGWAYRIDGKYEEALDEYKKFFKPDVPSIWQYRGKLFSSYDYALQGQYKKAIQSTREAIRIIRPFEKQRVIRSLRRLAGYYSSIGDTVRAFSLLDSALAMTPFIDEERFLYKQKGYLYAASGNQKELKKLIDILNMPEKQIEAELGWELPNILNIELYLLEGDIDKAKTEYDNLGWVYDFNLELKARVVAAAGDWENVILTTQEMQTSSLIANPRNYNYPRAYYIRGIAYEGMGKPELAIENYEALLDLWKDADEEIPERRDTIKRLAALKQGS